MNEQMYLQKSQTYLEIDDSENKIAKRPIY
jgi:hypothetical protein